METSAAILERMEALHPEVIDLTLGRVLRLLQASPEARGGYCGRARGTRGAGEALEQLAGLCNLCREFRRSPGTGGGTVAVARRRSELYNKCRTRS